MFYLMLETQFPNRCVFLTKTDYGKIQINLFEYEDLFVI